MVDDLNYSIVATTHCCHWTLFLSAAIGGARRFFDNQTVPARTRTDFRPPTGILLNTLSTRTERVLCQAKQTTGPRSSAIAIERRWGFDEFFSKKDI